MKRITAVLFALTLLVLPGSANASISNTDPWISFPVSGYNHWVKVCDVGIPDTMEPRIIDVLNKWNAVGGELHFSWTNWTDSNCDYQMGFSSDPIVKITHGTLSCPNACNTLGQTDNHWVNGSGQIYNCLITMDSRAGYASEGNRQDIGNFTWYFGGTGAPPVNQVDWESALLHEMGHCLAADGHLDSPVDAVMYQYMNPSPPGGDPRGVEKEALYTQDVAIYSGMYGTTH